jgi:pentapeptide MXKDX repeat protein
MKKTLCRLIVMCFLALPLPALAQSGDNKQDQSQQDEMKQDNMKHDEMRNDQMKDNKRPQWSR